jgi:hypothetical protein
LCPETLTCALRPIVHHNSEKEKMAFEKLKKRRAVERERRKIRSERLKSLLLESGIAVFNKFDIRRVISDLLLMAYTMICLTWILW